MIDPSEKGVITRTQNVCRGSPKPFNLSEQIISRLSVKTLESLSKLDRYQIPSGVIERLRQRKPFNDMTDLQLKQILDEFKKYIAILVINYRNGKRVEMVSELVDEIWHTFILFTSEYRKFCDVINEEYIHHEPNISLTYAVDPLFQYKRKQGTEFFYEEYERCFGPLPDLWTRKLPRQTKNYKNLKNPARFAILGTILCLVVYTLIYAYSLHYIVFAELATVYGLLAFAGIIAMYRYCKSRDSQYILGIGFGSIFITLLIMGAVVVLMCQEAYEIERAVFLIWASLIGSIVLFLVIRNWRRPHAKKPTLPTGYHSHLNRSGFYGGGCGSISSCDGGGGGCGGGGCGGGGCGGGGGC